MPDSTLSALSNIQTKVRRLTRSPSQAQITDAVINDYINTFVLYDFPEQLRLVTLRKVFTFYCDPYIDRYSTNTTDPTSPLYNFKNQYISVHPPVYVAGNNSMFSQSREQFYATWPSNYSIIQIGTGDGVNVNFTGTLPNVPFLQGTVLFDSISLGNQPITIHDVPNNPELGLLQIPNDPNFIYGTVNYITGFYNITMPTAPGNGEIVNAQMLPYVPSRPTSVLFYEDDLILRPVPDQPYKIDLEAYARPVEMLLSTQMNELSEWWQYIAYGAAKKIFEDRMDQESVQNIMPEFKMQERLINRRALVQMNNDRVATIYTESIEVGTNGTGFGSGSPF